MNISSVSVYACRKPNFSHNKNGYENPINRRTEKGLAVWGSVGTSAIIGGTAAGIGSCFIKSGIKNRGRKLGYIGIAAGLISMALTLPAKIYDAKVKAFAREKEMDVFSRNKELKSGILEEIDKEVKDKDVSLDKKINDYTTVQMADSGNGLLVKGV